MGETGRKTTFTIKFKAFLPIENISVVVRDSSWGMTGLRNLITSIDDCDYIKRGCPIEANKTTVFRKTLTIPLHYTPVKSTVRLEFRDKIRNKVIFCRKFKVTYFTA